jgi:hypothetical protein
MRLLILMILATIALGLGGCFAVLFVGAIATAPFMEENMPTCDMRHRPLLVRCREVRDQWGGERVQTRDPEVPW